MKRIAILSVIAVSIAITIGFVSKSTFQDNGIISISKIEDIRLLNCNVNQVFTDSDEFGIYQGEYTMQTLEELGNMAVILRVRPTNNIRQYNFTTTQQVQITAVVKGNAVIGALVELVYSGGGVYDQKYRSTNYTNDCPIYSGFTNYMLPNNEYLVFVDPLEINEFTDIKRYKIESPLFCVLNLTSDYSIPVDKPFNELTYNEFCESEFFCRSEKTLNRVLEIKHYIINHYAQ